jgi:plasmid stabilization system protein ParE
MIYNIIVEPEAISDLINIKSFISKDSPNRANNFISELKGKIKTLQEMPQRCRKSLYTEDKDTHDLIHKGYTIVYKIINDNVYVLTIFRQKAY